MEVARASGGRRIIYEAAALVPILGSHILEKGTISLWLAEVSSDECSSPMNFLPRVAHEGVSVETLTLYQRGLCGSGSIWLPNCTCVEFLSC
jgi:hypothetical protein